MVGWFKERVVAEDGRVLTVEDVLDLANRAGRGLPNPPNVNGNEEQVIRIDVTGVDEPFVFLGQRHGFLEFTKPHWSFMNW